MKLSGRLILDCSTLLPGPFLGKLLMAQGARVIKIENPDPVSYTHLTLPTNREV